jgi:predicted RecA/RadA family phage recombinase
MATNYVQPGNVVTLTAPSGGVVSGSFYKIGSLVVCAMASAAVGAEFEAALNGVWSVTKETHATDQAWTEGMAVYWDNTNSRFTKTSTSNTRCGYAAAAAGSTASSGQLLLVQTV